jgi:hypothetical protein
MKEAIFDLQNLVPTRNDTMPHRYEVAETVATLGMPESSEMGTRDEGHRWGPQSEPSKSPTLIWGSMTHGQAIFFVLSALALFGMFAAL